MQLSETVFEGPMPIESYGPGFFRIAGEVHHGPLAVLPDGIAVWDNGQGFAQFLAKADLFDVLFLGTGSEIAPLDAASRKILEEAGIGVEIMATPAACRTYNVLLAEGRRIAAALTPI